MSLPSPIDFEALWEARNIDPDGVLAALSGQDDPRAEALAANILQRRGDLAEALRLCEAAGERLTAADIWLTRLLSTQSAVYEALLRPQEAIALQEECLAIAHQIGDHFSVIAAVNDLGETVRPTNPALAAECYQQGLALARQHDQPELQAVCHLNLAQVGVLLGQDRTTRRTHLEAARRLAWPNWPDVAEYARVELISDRLDEVWGGGAQEGEAQALLEQMPTPEAFTDAEIRGQVALLRARLLQATGQTDAAVNMLEVGLDSARYTDRPLLLNLLSRLHENAGRLPEALHAARREAEEYREQMASSHDRLLAAMEVSHRTAQFREAAQDARRRAEELDQNLRALREANERIREISIRDGLTGLYNRQHLMEAGQLALRSAAADRPAQVALLDVDLFKRINDRYGHQIGDAVLRALAEVLRRALPPTDLIARYGGEEFVVIRPPAPHPAPAHPGPAHPGPANPAPLRDDLRRLSDQLNSGPLNLDRHELEAFQVSISVGVQVAESPDLDRALHAADLLMYGAKRSGGGQVHWQTEHPLCARQEG